MLKVLAIEWVDRDVRANGHRARLHKDRLDPHTPGAGVPFDGDLSPEG